MRATSAVCGVLVVLGTYALDLAVDAMLQADKLEQVLLVTGDGDFIHVATALRPLSFGLIIVLFLMFEPRGIANWWRILRTYVKLWPFRY